MTPAPLLKKPKEILTAAEQSKYPFEGIRQRQKSLYLGFAAELLPGGNRALLDHRFSGDRANRGSFGLYRRGGGCSRRSQTAVLYFFSVVRDLPDHALGGTKPGLKRLYRGRMRRRGLPLGLGVVLS